MTKLFRGLLLFSLCLGFACRHPAPSAGRASSSGSIPSRPEQLKFPPLRYQPPLPSEHRVVLKSGPVAYVVPDRELPLVNLVIMVRAGDYVEPADKEGLAGMTGYLLARSGTPSRNAKELEDRLAFLAAQLNSGVGDTQGSVSLNLLSKDLDEGLAILREVLSAPRFQEDRVELARDQTLQSIRQRNDESSSIEARERNFLSLGESFFANRHSTGASINGLTVDDLRAFHRRWFHPSNFVVAASGDFKKEEMVARLEKLFADWPYVAEKPPPVPTQGEFAKPGVYLVDKKVNQGRVSIMLPGIMRTNPDYFAVLLMNDILGGGGFTSHIMNRVRSDEGLAYSAGSSFPGGIYYTLPFTASFQSKSRTVAYAASIVLEEMERIQKAAVTPAELETSKQSFINRLPTTFSTKSNVARTLAQDEFTGRYAVDPDFWQKYRARVEAVTPEEIQRVARKYLSPGKPVILVVGDKEEILKGHPNHPVTLQSLSGNRLVDVPLRDPLTMKPVMVP